MLQFNPQQRLTISQIKQHPWYQGQVMTSEEMFMEFSQRKKKVEQELQAEKMKKE